MTGHLPPEFFAEFFHILLFKPEEAVAFQEKLHDLGQRKFLQEQLAVLPPNEQQVFNDILNQNNVSADTINEFLEDRLDDELRSSLWQKSLIYLWQEVLDRVKDLASAEQREQIKVLVQKYLIQD
jgi:hypothetical protein